MYCDVVPSSLQLSVSSQSAASKNFLTLFKRSDAEHTYNSIIPEKCLEEKNNSQQSYGHIHKDYIHEVMF